MITRRLYITGLVQGVGYRASFAVRARELALSGWVRNRRDGAVEALVSGEVEAVGLITEWARQGPPGARVGNLRIEELPDPAPPAGTFDILPTA